MKQRLQQLESQFQQRSQREKVLIAVSLVLAISLGAWYLWYEPALQSVAMEQSAVAQQRTSLQGFEAEVSRIQRDLQIDPNQVLRQREIELQARKRRLESSLSERAQLMPSEAAVNWVNALLDTPAGVEVLSFEVQQAVALNAVATPGQGASEQGNVWRHTVELSVSGQYRELRGYIETLDTLEQPFYWQGLRYQVATHPDSVLRLQVYVLSTEKELFSG